MHQVVMRSLDHKKNIYHYIRMYKSKKTGKRRVGRPCKSSKKK